MALGAGNRPVRAFQRELGGGMVEGDHVFPGPRGVTDLAVLFRRRCEFSLVGIRVTADAG